MKFRKPETIPLLFIVAAVCVLTTFGVWQLKRLAWKEDLIAAIEAAQSQPAVEKLPESLPELAYRKASLKGTFMYDKTLRKAGGLPGVAEPGFFLLTPFQLADSRIILVNRGFSPAGKESRPLGKVTIKAVLRPPREKRYFSPQNQPARNLWFYEDIPAMEQATSLKLLPMIAEATGRREKEVYPMPGDGRIALRNDHLGYAITWFSLALVAVVMFAFYQRDNTKA